MRVFDLYGHRYKNKHLFKIINFENDLNKNGIFLKNQNWQNIISKVYGSVIIKIKYRVQSALVWVLIELTLKKKTLVINFTTNE